jgi:uncharacterized membrane protein YoaK (UPF0700 family)
LLVSFLLFASVPLLAQGSAYGVYTAACACGLQNAMVSTYSGTVVRTTHVSGMFTDLGISAGHFLRGLPVDNRRISLCLTVITGFLSGGMTGTIGFRSLSYAALLIPATLTASVALAYGFYLWRRRHR